MKLHKRAKKTNLPITKNSNPSNKLYRPIQNKSTSTKLNLPTQRLIKRSWAISNLNPTSSLSNKFPWTITHIPVLGFIPKSLPKISSPISIKYRCIFPTFTSISISISVKDVPNQDNIFLWSGKGVSGLSTISTICMLSKMFDS